MLRKVLAPRDGALPMEQWRFAKKVGCSVETIRKIEKGKMPLSEQLAYKIHVATGVSLNWLRANDLTVLPHRDFGREFNRETYEAAQVENAVPGLMGTADETAVGYAAAVASVVLSAAKKGDGPHRLAAKRLSEITRELVVEFGRDVDFSRDPSTGEANAGALKDLCIRVEVKRKTDQAKYDAGRAEFEAFLRTPEGRKMFEDTNDAAIREIIGPR